MDHKFDLYLNGHEHDLEYAYYPYEQFPEVSKINDLKMQSDFYDSELDGFNCEDNVEHIFNDF